MTRTPPHTLPPPALPDARLVDAARRGNRDAFAALAARYEKSLLAVSLAITRSHPDARDAAQDALLLAYQRLRQLRDPTRFGPWLLKIARRSALRLRKHRRRENPSADLYTTPARPDGPVAHSFSDDLLAALDRLPAAQRHFILLRYLDGLSTPDIARLTATPLGSVTKQLSRAHEKLRRYLHSENPHA
ncbi:MAG TPA: sigma-70 family RNA polymerase sigma factor [Phycisphaerae bacterium]|nr:sigma-70 family RNA polymerase sigma factor [Phycisphaerae bacterium]